MRQNSFNKIDNIARNMQRSQRDYILKEIYKYQGVEASSTERLRNGINNFGARQMMGLIYTDGSAMVGMTMESTTVGS